MQKVQIYVGATRLDLFKDETIKLTQSLKNINKVDKIFTEFTQTFSVPASSTNNILFQHYYNFNIAGGFDARRKQPASIELNYIPFKTGLMRLDGVDLKKNKAYAYRITFFGETVNLKDILATNQIDSLNFDIYNTTYEPNTVLDGMELDPLSLDSNGNYNNNLVVPLISHTNPIFYDSDSPVVSGTNNMYYELNSGAGVFYSDLKYALRVETIVNAISTDYLVPAGLSFSDDFFNTENKPYSTLFLWLHRKSGSVGVGTAGSNQLSLPVSSWTRTSGTTLTTTGTSIIISSQYQSPPSANISQFDVRIVPTDPSKEYTLIINTFGSEFYSSGLVKGILSLTKSDFNFIQPVSYTFVLNSTEEVVFDTVTLIVSGDFQIGNGLQYWTDNFSATANGNITIPLAVPFVINEQIPEMKIIDFLTGIFKMFNLVAYYEDSKIVVKTYDDYFASLDTGLWNFQNSEWQDELRKWNEIGSTTSNEYSIDEFLDTRSVKVDVALPYKQINFLYEGTGTILAKKYNQLNNIGWGEIRYTLDGLVYDAPSDVYNVKIPFEHMQMERLNDLNLSASDTQTNVMYGISVNENVQPYIGKPLLFYPIKQSQAFGSATSVSVRSALSTNVEKTDIIVPSNSVSLNPAVSVENINFPNEINEWTLNSDFSNSLFEGYYKTFISESFNLRRRFIKVKAYLPLNILYNLKLNNVIEINNERYKINSMSTNFQTGLTNFELINIL